MVPFVDLIGHDHRGPAEGALIDKNIRTLIRAKKPITEETGTRYAARDCHSNPDSARMPKSVVPAMIWPRICCFVGGQMRAEPCGTDRIAICGPSGRN